MSISPNKYRQYAFLHLKSYSAKIRKKIKNKKFFNYYNVHFINTSSLQILLQFYQKAIPKITQMHQTKQHIYVTEHSENGHIKGIVKIVNQFAKSMDKNLSNMLLHKENEVSNVYNQKIFRIKDQLAQMQKLIYEKDHKIMNYQEQGMIAKLLTRIKFLQEEQNKHLKAIEKKNSQIKQLKLINAVNKSENKRLEEKAKQFIKYKAQNFAKAHNSSRVYQSIQTFSTQISPQKQSISSRLKLEKKKSFSLQKKIKDKHILISQTTINSEQLIRQDMVKLQKQILNLKKQNRQLISINNKIMQQYRDAQNILLNSVAQIKSNIMARKKIKKCSYEDFRKQDKLELLIKIISNQQVLLYLYQKIFAKKAYTGFIQINQHESMIQRKQKQVKRSHPKARFPTLNSSKTAILS